MDNDDLSSSCCVKCSIANRKHQLECDGNVHGLDFVFFCVALDHAAMILLWFHVWLTLLASLNSTPTAANVRESEYLHELSPWQQSSGVIVNVKNYRSLSDDC